MAEALRLREIRHGRCDDVAANRAARHEADGLEPRIVARAAHLGASTGLTEAVVVLASRADLAAVGLAALALAGGVGAAFAVAGDGSRAINVVWALGGLLGLHVLSLLIWIGGFAFSGAVGPSGLGAAWTWISARLSGGGEAARALAGLHARAGLTRWWLGAVTHGVWSAALVGAMLGLLATFMLRGHGFMWETTLLPADFFVRLVGVAGWLPEKLGFAVPDPGAVAASGGMVLAEESARRAWASWLVACVMVYGVVPRLLLWAWCARRLRLGRAGLRLDTSLPGFVELALQLAPASERIGVTDAAPDAISAARVGGGAGLAGEAALVGIELRGDIPWPPALPMGVRDAGLADGREQRARVLEGLAARSVGRLLVACDPRLSPDRGSLAFIAELSRHAGVCRVWLLTRPGNRDAVRRAHWREGLVGIGLKSEDLIEDDDQALAWLGGAQ